MPSIVTPSTRFALEELQSARGFTLTRENWEALFTTIDGLYKFHKYLKKKNGNEVLIAVLERLLFAISNCSAMDTDFDASAPDVSTRSAWRGV